MALNSKFVCGVCLLAAVFFGSFAYAANSIDILDKQRQQVMPEPKSQQRIPVQEDETPPGVDNSVPFILHQLVLDGGSPALSSEKLLQPYADRLGKRTTFNEMQAVASALTKAYREAGYTLSLVVLPPQEVDPEKAVVRFQVLEGFIESIDIAGDADIISRFESYFSAQKAKLLAMRPLYHPDFERIMLLLQDVPGLSVASSFVPGEQAGGSILKLEVGLSYVGGNLNTDNTGTKSSGPYMLNVGVNINALPILGAHTAISYGQASEFKEYFYWQISQSYRMANGLAFHGTYGQSGSPQPDTEFARMFDYETSSQSFSLGASYPLIRSRDMNWSLSSTFNYRNSNSELQGRRNTRDRIRQLTVTSSFDMADTWGGVNQLVIDYTRGLPWFNASNKSAESSRPVANSEFNVLKIYASRTQELPAALSLLVSGQLQVADTPLFSYEQYSLGGSQFGRGYSSGALSGDMAIAASAELRWMTQPTDIFSIQPFLFVDWGQVRNRSVLDIPGRWEQLSSAGFGVRVWLNGEKPWPRLSASLLLGKPMQRVAGINMGAWRCVGQIGLTF